MRIRLGHIAFGVAGIVFGVITLVWHDFNTWQQITVLGNFPHRGILAYAAGTVEILGGAALLWPRTMRVGVVTLGVIYSVFALLCTSDRGASASLRPVGCIF